MADKQGRNARLVIGGTLFARELENGLQTSSTSSESRDKDGVRNSTSSTSGTLTASCNFSDYASGTTFEKYLRDKQRSNALVDIERAFFDYDASGNIDLTTKEFRDGALYRITEVGDTNPTEGGATVNFTAVTDSTLTSVESEFTTLQGTLT